MRERGPVDVAHGDGRDQVAVQQGGAGQRQAIAGDDAAFLRLRQRCRECRDLVGLFALGAGQRARYRVEQQVLAVLPGGVRDLVVSQRGRKSRERLGYFNSHGILLGISPTRAEKR